jgi:hypothetical protein
MLSVLAASGDVSKAFIEKLCDGADHLHDMRTVRSQGSKQRKHSIFSKIKGSECWRAGNELETKKKRKEVTHQNQYHQ